MSNLKTTVQATREVVNDTGGYLLDLQSTFFAGWEVFGDIRRTRSNWSMGLGCGKVTHFTGAKFLERRCCIATVAADWLPNV
jgi:hypothetical protein